MTIMDFIAWSIFGYMDPCQVISTLDTKSDIELTSSVVITFCVLIWSISLNMDPYYHIMTYNEVCNCII